MKKYNPVVTKIYLIGAPTIMALILFRLFLVDNVNPALQVLHLGSTLMLMMLPGMIPILLFDVYFSIKKARPWIHWLSLAIMAGTLPMAQYFSNPESTNESELYGVCYKRATVLRQEILDFKKSQGRLPTSTDDLREKGYNVPQHCMKNGEFKISKKGSLYYQLPMFFTCFSPMSAERIHCDVFVRPSTIDKSRRRKGIFDDENFPDWLKENPEEDPHKKEEKKAAEEAASENP